MPSYAPKRPVSRRSTNRAPPRSARSSLAPAIWPGLAQRRHRTQAPARTSVLGGAQALRVFSVSQPANMMKTIWAFYYPHRRILTALATLRHMLTTQGCHGVAALATQAAIDYMQPIQNYRRSIMLSQRRLASQFQARFVLQLWNAMLRVQTRETASFFGQRSR